MFFPVPSDYDSDGYHQRPRIRGDASPDSYVPGTWSEMAQDELNNALNVEHNTNVAKNVILFLGDGMGVSTVTAARFFKMQKARLDDPTYNMTMKEARLLFEDFPHNALSMVLIYELSTLNKHLFM